MRAILLDDAVPSYLDETAAEILARARAAARDARIASSVQLLRDRTVLSLWSGTRIHRTLQLVLLAASVPVEAADDVALHIDADSDAWLPALQRFIDAPDARVLAAYADDKLGARLVTGEKFDRFLPAEVWRASYARQHLDLDGAVRVARRLVAEAQHLAVASEPCSVDARVVAIGSLERWADEVAALETLGPLPTRVVLVPGEAHAHALRKQLVTRTPRALLGTRFFTAASAARAVLDAAAVTYTLGEERRRPLRLRKLFRARPPLAHYRADELGTSGWEAAFASTIEQLEAAALRPDDLERLGDPAVADLAAIWRAIEADASSSWTIPRAIAEATAILAGDPRAWPFDAHTLAAVPFGIDAVHARLLHAIPRVTLGVLPGRPARRWAIERTRVLLGEAAAAWISVVEPGAVTDELGLLAGALFEAPDRLGAPDRPRSPGSDGSVSLELYAGVDEELEAAARWVADEVFDHGTPLQELAILVPAPDPLAPLLADRIRAMSWPVDAAPVYLACGRPAVATSSGARLLALVDALRRFLPASAMVELLPRLRLAGGDGHVTPGRARSIVAWLATLGGSAARPTDATAWRDRLGDPDADESVGALVPAIAELVALADDMLVGASLELLWRGIRAFASAHLIAREELDEVLDLLGDDVSAIATDPVAQDVGGVDAIELIASLLRALRLHEGRFGAPSIYIGTITGAAGLAFTAIRVIGLAEGAFPGTLREDAILPAEARRRLPAHALRSDDDRATAQLHAFHQVLRGARARVALSTHRTAVDGSEREPASLFVEVAAALGRLDTSTGGRARTIPTMADLERDAFAVERARLAARSVDAPLGAATLLRRVAADRAALPSTWSQHIVLDPRAVLERSSQMDGLLGAAPLTVGVPGTSFELPISASALRVLLTCPQRFLLERMLPFRPRRHLGAAHRIEPAAYGELFHEIIAAFLQHHGAEFGARHHDLPHWLNLANALAHTRFDAFVDEHSLMTSVVDAERRRLLRDVRTLIEDDWDPGRPRIFIAAEREFGHDSAVSIATVAGPLFVHGRIDRIDLEAGLTLVRDLKTGRAPHRPGPIEPAVDLDLQLAVYAAVAKRLASAWAIPADVAAGYAYVDPIAPSRERAFRAERAALHAAGERWFELAMTLLRNHTYIQTPDPEDCARCPFAPVCGDDAPATALRLRDAAGPLGAFRELKA